VVVTSPSDISVTIPGGTNVTGGKVYVSNATGQELLFGSANAGSAVTINALPAPSAAAAPTASGTGLPAGTYWVEYSWVGNNGTGETAAGGENVLSLPGNQDLSITLPTAPAGASTANIYVGSTSGGETFAATAGSGATVVLNRLPSGGVAAPTWNGTFNPSSNVTSPVIVNNASSIANTSSNPGGVEARYYNQQLIDYNRVGGSTTNDKFNVALNGLVTEYTKISTNAFAGQDSLGGTWMYAGAIDFNWSSQPTSFTGVNGSTNSPDPRNYPDIERVHNTDQTSLFTGQIVANQTGVYTVITNTDDDGFLWIDDKLVSADPNGHGQQDANNTRTYGNNVNDSLIPVSLIAGSHYNFVFLQQEGGGGSGAHLKWIQPQVTSGKVQAANNCTNQNGATITLDPNSSSGTNGAYNGFTVYITGGTGNGEKGVITGYNGTSHQAIVNVTGGGNSLLWGTVPDTSSSYKIAWEQGIPLLGAGTSSGQHNGNGEGLMQYMSVPHNEVYNPQTGSVNDHNPVINLNDTSNSAASGVTITNIDPNKGVSLKWTDQSASELWFEVQRSSDNGTTWATIGKTPMIIGTTFTDQSGGNAFNSSTVAYSYRVRGVNFDGVGPWSNVAATNSLPTPGSPAINAVVQGDAGTIGLTFGNNVLLGGGIELQEQDITTGGTFQDVTRNPLPANTFDYLVTGLNPAHTYAFQVQSVKTPNLPASGFSTPVTVIPSGAIAESIGTPGQLDNAYTNGAAITGQFSSAGD